METLNNNPDLFKTKFNAYCDITSEKVIWLDLDPCITDDIIANISGHGEGKSNEEEPMML